MRHSYFQGRVKVLHFEGIEDSRGVLLPIDFKALNFSPIRSFLVNGKNGVTRGGHAHRDGTQLLLRISGEIQVDLALDGEERTITLGPDTNAILLSAPVWSSQTYRGRSPGLMVFSDQPFDPSGYIVARD
jgi:dTDP-4-dehydrorhamnose 3,5-epimerase-like enzyme